MAKSKYNWEYYVVKDSQTPATFIHILHNKHHPELTFEAATKEGVYKKMHHFILFEVSPLVKEFKNVIK